MPTDLSCDNASEPITELKELTFNQGDVLYDTSTPLVQAYFVLSGEVALSLKLGDKTLALTVGENHFVGDAAVVVNQKPNAKPLQYNATATALTPLKVMVVPVALLTEELDACPPLLRAWIASFTHRSMLAIAQLAGISQEV